MTGVGRGLRWSSSGGARRTVVPPTPPRRREQKPAGAGLAPRRRPAWGPAASTLAQVAQRGRDVPAPPPSRGTLARRRSGPNSAPPTPTPLRPRRSPAAAPRPPQHRRPRAFVRPRREQRAPPDEGRPGWGKRLGALHNAPLLSLLRAPEDASAAGLTSPPASRALPDCTAGPAGGRASLRSPEQPRTAGAPSFRERRGARPGKEGARARAAHARCSQPPRQMLAVWFRPSFVVLSLAS